MNKTVYVNAHFAPIGQYQTVQVPTGEVKKGLLGGEKQIMREEQQWVQTGYSDSIVDGQKLSNDIAEVVAELNNDGFEVVSITPVISGKYNHVAVPNAHRIDNHCAGGGYSYGYGYSYTEGVVIIARKA